MDQGFDEFFGYTDAVHAWEKFPTTLWNGRERIQVSGYIDNLITDRAVEFVRKQKEKPFFLYLPYVAPHFGIAAPADEISRIAAGYPRPIPTCRSTRPTPRWSPV